MKHIYKIIAVLVVITAVWVALLETSTVPRSYTWLVSATDFACQFLEVKTRYISTKMFAYELLSL